MAATRPSKPIEMLRMRTRRPSPARVEPITLRDSSCPILESTITAIDRTIREAERFAEEPQYWVDDPLSWETSGKTGLTDPF
jgi:hypothetical protein